MSSPVQAQLLGHFGDDCENMGHYGGVVLCHLGHRSDMGLGDNQKVGGRLGIDVMEGKAYLVLVDFVGRDLPLRNLTKQTVRHWETSFVC